jgi:hypothetical protein
MAGHHVNAIYFKNTPHLLYTVLDKFMFDIKLFKYIIEGELMPYVTGALSSCVAETFLSRLSRLPRSNTRAVPSSGS